MPKRSLQCVHEWPYRNQIMVKDVNKILPPPPTRLGQVAFFLGAWGAVSWECRIHALRSHSGILALCFDMLFMQIRYAFNRMSSIRCETNRTISIGCELNRIFQFGRSFVSEYDCFMQRVGRSLVLGYDWASIGKLHLRHLPISDIGYRALLGGKVGATCHPPAASCISGVCR